MKKALMHYTYSVKTFLILALTICLVCLSVLFSSCHSTPTENDTRSEEETTAVTSIDSETPTENDTRNEEATTTVTSIDSETPTENDTRNEEATTTVTSIDSETQAELFIPEPDYDNIHLSISVNGVEQEPENSDTNEYSCNGKFILEIWYNEPGVPMACDTEFRLYRIENDELIFVGKHFFEDCWVARPKTDTEYACFEFYFPDQVNFINSDYTSLTPGRYYIEYHTCSVYVNVTG